jgi:hypothetical protein
VSDENFIRKNYVKREHYDAILAQLAAIEALKREGEKKEDDSR